MPFRKFIGLWVLLLIAALPLRADDRENLEAIETTRDSIESLARERGPFSQDLFEPLMQLARLQLEFGTTEDAIDSLQRAQNVAHRNEGVYTPRQLQIVELMTDLALQAEEYDDANRQQKFAFFVTRHAYEDSHPDVFNAFSELADWYMNTGQPRRARKLLKKAGSLAEETGQDASPFIIMENRAKRLEGICCNPKRLLEVVEKIDFEHQPETLTAIYLEIADTLTLGGRSKQAATFFMKAHQLSPLKQSTDPHPLTIRRALDRPQSAQVKIYRLSQDSRLPTRRLERMTEQELQQEPEQEPHWFIFDPDNSHLGFSTRDVHETYERAKRTYKLVGNPILFNEDQLNFALPLRLEKNKEDLKIEFSFTVSETGNLEDIEVIDSNAPVRLNRLVTNALKRAYYRPALENGIPIATRNVSLVQTFGPRSGRAE
ncbi:MAG: hypothetical protein HOC70_02660 [Gammaproteobacteria bacterium]|jgi:tetratricopeptide (TPR) repeat protein|nr:hypothetical protein [Gammaproteobacteria bacterium]MBT7371305.1 hypothetical protein [Gammaproteobacteria bacterium]